MQARRITIDKNVIINRTTPAECLNLSRSGMYLFSRERFNEGSLLQVSLELGGEVFDLPARVERADPGLGYGVSFLDLPEDTATFFERYVYRRASLEQRF